VEVDICPLVVLQDSIGLHGSSISLRVKYYTWCWLKVGESAELFLEVRGKLKSLVQNNGIYGSMSRSILSYTSQMAGNVTLYYTASWLVI
jgi:hypothetical protein